MSVKFKDIDKNFFGQACKNYYFLFLYRKKVELLELTLVIYKLSAYKLSSTLFFKLNSVQTVQLAHPQFNFNFRS